MEQIEDKISILVLTYNHEQFIEVCLNSILSQKVDIPFEIVISDDASKDRTVDILTQYENRYDNIKVLKSSENRGLIINYLKCLDACDGKYFATVAGDDYWTDENKLQKQLDFLRNNPEYGLVHTDNSIMFEDNGDIVTSRHSTWPVPIPEGKVFNNLLIDNFIGALTILSYTKVIKDAITSIRLRESSWLMEDFPIWLEISTKYKIGYIPNITAMHRYNRHSLSNPKDRRKNYELIFSSYTIRFYFIERYSEIINPDIIETINHNYAAFIFERSFLLNDRVILSHVNGIYYSPNNLKERLYYIASRKVHYAGILRFALKIKQSITKN